MYIEGLKSISLKNGLKDPSKRKKTQLDMLMINQIEVFADLQRSTVGHKCFHGSPALMTDPHHGSDAITELDTLSIDRHILVHTGLQLVAYKEISLSLAVRRSFL